MNKIRNMFAIVVFAIFLSGCVNTPKQYLTQTPIEVKEQQLAQYWQIINSSFDFKIQTGNYTEIPKGTVIIHYLIDSNGNVFKPRVVSSTSDGLLTKAALKAVNQMRYKKAETNPLAIPVYNMLTINFG